MAFSSSHTRPDQPRALAPQYNLRQAADVLGVGESTIRRMIARGELRAYRYGPRIIRIDPADLRALGKPVTSLAELRGGDVA